jgi:hypothetical protein
MSVAFRSCALLLAAATAASTADPVVEELFQQTREKVLDNARRMPRYTCVETVSRAQYDAPRGSAPSCQSLIAMRKLTAARGVAMFHDRLRLDVAVIDQSEIFSWAGAGKFETRDVGDLAGGGASGSGEFGGFLSSVFGSAPEEIQYVGRRNSQALFDYVVPVSRSGYRVNTNPKDKGRILGYRGTFSVDPADGDLQQLVVETDEFSASDEVCHVQHTMDYSRVKIGKSDFLLPEVSTMDALYRNGSEAVNETRYTDCREYIGESTIRFDDVDAVTGNAAAKSPLQPLPSKTRLSIGLTTPINTEIAAAGDAVEGVLLRDVADKKLGMLARTNDRVHGRILRLQQYSTPTPRWLIAIRFDSMDRGGVEQPLSLKPLDDGDRSGQRLRAPNLRDAVEKPAGSGLFIFGEHGNFILDQKFHSEWETR